VVNWHGKVRTARQISVRERAAAAPPCAARALRRAGTARVHRAVAGELAAAVMGARCDRTAAQRAGTFFTRIDAICTRTTQNRHRRPPERVCVVGVACVAHTVAR
jgi:hypothetical protein